LFVLIQVFVFNQLEIGFDIHPMVYPLFIMLLPFSMTTVATLFIAFFMGFFIDLFSNTGGLHASALLIFAFFRPIVFKAFSPRDGYDLNKEPSIYEMGSRWFINCFGILLILHHGWFFFLEAFKFSELLYVLKKIILSAPISYVMALLLQFLFIRVKPSK
jgi:hypothetical protein